MAGAPLLASVAKRQGALAGAAAASAPGYMAQPPIAVHASPEVASVGLSETEARKAYEQVSVGYAEYSASARAFALGSEQGVVKLVVDADSGEILGGHIIGAGATELISAVALAMAAEATVDTLAVAVHAHPSVAELISEAARQALLPS
jgi:dihydrolipoamide dehydrogenase